MVHGTVRSFFQLLGAIGVTVLVLLAWFGYRLSEGPLSLSLLGPYIEDALSSPDKGFTVHQDRTILAWSRDTRTIEIRVENVRALSRDQGVIAEVPEIVVAFSGPALIQGRIVPRRLLLRRPVIRLLRDFDGEISVGLGAAEETGEKSTAAFEEPLQALLEPPGAETPGGQLQRVEVEGADISVDDRVLKVRWHAPKADIRLNRDLRGIVAHARIDLDLAGEQARFDAEGLYVNAGRTVEATLSFGGIRPTVLADLVPQLAPLSGLHLPTGGSVAMRYALGRGLSDVHFDLVGGEGVIDASSSLGISIPVQSVALKGALTDHLNHVTLEEGRIDLGGPLVTLSAEAANLSGATDLRAQARIDDLPLDLLKGLWPPEVAPNPRSWILANLSDGRIRTGSVQLAAHRPAGKGWGDLTIDRIGGELRPEGISVQYLAPMPVIRHVDAVATFDADAFTIDVSGGEVSGLRLGGGKVVLSGLSAPDQFADIVVTVNGAVADVLRLIDSKPLEWARALGVQPSRIKGEQTTTLALRFPLLNRLSFDQVAVHASAQTTRFGLPEVALGLDLTEGQFSVDVDASGLDVVGRGQIGGIASDIKWHENFTKGGIRSRYQVSAVLGDADRRTVGLDASPFQPPFLAGPVPVDLSVTLSDGQKGDVEVKASLTDAAMSLPGLNWDKPAATAGQASILLRLAGGHITEMPKLQVGTANGLDMQAQGAFDAGQLRRLTFGRAKWGRTDARGSITINPGNQGLGIEIGGASFDAREIISGEPSDHATDKAKPVPDTPKKRDHSRRDDLLPLAIQGKFGRVWVSDEGALHTMTATLVRDHRDWRQVRLDGLLEGDQPLHVDLAPAGADRRSLKMTSGDAGQVLKSFDIYDNVVHGRLQVDAAYDDAKPSQPLSGQISVSDFQLVRAPALARLLTVASLTGIVDVLQGSGIPFSSLESPFTLADGVLTLRDVRASGTSLGITAKGQVDLDNDVLALEGTIVPIYTLNSVLGRLPVLGDLFTTEKGGGVFAMNYSMNGPSKDPSVTVNPLSALTPGMLRRLFNIFDNGSETEVRPHEKPADPPSAPPLPRN